MQDVVATAGLLFGLGFFSGFLFRKNTFFSNLLGLFLIFIGLFLISRVHEETLLAAGLALGFVLGKFKGFATGTVYFLGRVFSFIDRLVPERNKLTPEEEEILRQWHAFKKDEEYNRQADAKRQQREQEEQAWRAREEHSDRARQERRQSEQSDQQEYRREYREERSKSEERDWQKEQEQAQERRRQAQEKAKAKKIQGYLDILGLEGVFTAASLLKAYRKKRSEYHPDKHPNATEEQKKKFEELFNLVQEAYDFLKKL